MPDPKQEDDDNGPGTSTRDRWGTGADGIEQAGTVGEFEDLATPEQKERRAEYERIRAQSLKLAQDMAAAGGDDEDEDAADDTEAARKD